MQGLQHSWMPTCVCMHVRLYETVEEQKRWDGRRKIQWVRWRQEHGCSDISYRYTIIIKIASHFWFSVTVINHNLFTHTVVTTVHPAKPGIDVRRSYRTDTSSSKQSVSLLMWIKKLSSAIPLYVCDIFISINMASIVHSSQMGKQARQSKLRIWQCPWACSVTCGWHQKTLHRLKKRQLNWNWGSWTYKWAWGSGVGRVKGLVHRWYTLWVNCLPVSGFLATTLMVHHEEGHAHP